MPREKLRSFCLFAFYALLVSLPIAGYLFLRPVRVKETFEYVDSIVLDERIAFDGGEDFILSSRSLGEQVQFSAIPDSHTPPFKLVSKNALRAEYKPWLIDPHGALTFYLDESKGEGTGYDILHCRHTATGRQMRSLTIGLMKDPPDEVIPMKRPGSTWSVFDPITIPVDYGGKIGERDRRVLLRVRKADDVRGGPAKYTLMLSGPCKTGKMEIGGVGAEVGLFQPYQMGREWDRSQTNVYVGRGDQREIESIDWWRMIDGEIYRFSTDALGERLTLERYAGKRGALSVRSRDGSKKGWVIGGFFETSDEQCVWVSSAGGERDSADSPPLVLPEGDYRPYWMHVRVGDTLAAFDSAEVVEGEKVSIRRNAEKYGVRVRKRRPFELNMTRAPDVIFLAPSRDKTYKPGRNIDIQVALIDHSLGARISGVTDMSRTVEFTYTQADGAEKTVTRHPLIEPVFEVKNSNGDVVGSGTMSNVGGDMWASVWRVPASLVTGGGEEFAVEVTVDTLDLYGEVKGVTHILIGGE
jgi:hypothetical protein